MSPLSDAQLGNFLALTGDGIAGMGGILAPNRHALGRMRQGRLIASTAKPRSVG
jgi:hypothetical protein